MSYAVAGNWVPMEVEALPEALVAVRAGDVVMAIAVASATVVASAPFQTKSEPVVSVARSMGGSVAGLWRSLCDRVPANV